MATTRRTTPAQAAQLTGWWQVPFTTLYWLLEASIMLAFLCLAEA